MGSRTVYVPQYDKVRSSQAPRAVGFYNCSAKTATGWRNYNVMFAQRVGTDSIAIHVCYLQLSRNQPVVYVARENYTQPG